MPRAVVLGGNGPVGSTAALRLASAGWEVTSTGQAQRRFPQALADVGVRFVRSDRYAADDLEQVLRTGADLVVDCVGYTAEHARLLVPFQQSIGSLVFISSKAVYVDDEGRHANSDEPPTFAGPCGPDATDDDALGCLLQLREGYGANKVAAEVALLDSGMSVQRLRPSRIHGVGAARPLEWVFVTRALENGGTCCSPTRAGASTTRRPRSTWRRSWNCARRTPGHASSTAPTPTHRTG